MADERDRYTIKFTTPARTRAREATSPPAQTEQPSAIRPALLTVEASAEYLSIGRTRMYELLAGPDPAIPSVKIGTSRRVRVADLDAYVRRLAEEAAREE